MEPREIAGVMELLQQGFPNFRPDANTVLAWAAIMAPFDARDVRNAAVALCRGKDPHSNPSFVPTTASLCRLTEECAKERGEAEERKLRNEGRILSMRTSTGENEAAKHGAAIRARLAQGEALADILNKIGRPMHGPPTTDAEMNTARNKALDAIEGFKPDPLTAWDGSPITDGI